MNEIKTPEKPGTTPIVKNGHEGLAVMKIKPVKLKDKLNRNRIVINMQDVFGFLPKILVIDKVFGQSNTIEISAVIPEEIKHEAARKKGIGVEKGAKEKTQGA